MRHSMEVRSEAVRCFDLGFSEASASKALGVSEGSRGARSIVAGPSFSKRLPFWSAGSTSSPCARKRTPPPPILMRSCASAPSLACGARFANNEYKEAP